MKDCKLHHNIAPSATGTFTPAGKTVKDLELINWADASQVVSMRAPVTVIVRALFFYLSTTTHNFLCCSAVEMTATATTSSCSSFWLVSARRAPSAWLSYSRLRWRTAMAKPL